MDDGQYHIHIAGQRADEIDDAYRNVETLAADLDRRISEVEAAQAKAEQALEGAEHAQAEAEEIAENSSRRPNATARRCRPSPTAA